MTNKKAFFIGVLSLLTVAAFLSLLAVKAPAKAAGEREGKSAWTPPQNALAGRPAAPEAVCTPDTPSMLSYWPLGETSGTDFLDVVDGNDGSCTNCPAPVAGLIGGAQQFTSSHRDGIEITETTGHELSWDLAESFSFEMWVNFTETCGTEANPNKVFFGRYRGTLGQSQWWVGCAPGGYPAFSLRDGALPSVRIMDDVAINDGAWHHIVAVQDAGAAANRLYVDGLEAINIATSYIGTFSSTGVISMGYYANGYYFDGKLDEVAVYDKALSAAEVENHYNTGLGQSYCTEAPVSEDQSVSTVVNGAVDITLTATDFDGDPLTYSVVDDPQHGALTGSGATWTYTPDTDYIGSDSFTFKANDGTVDSNVATVTITITPGNMLFLPVIGRGQD